VRRCVSCSRRFEVTTYRESATRIIIAESSRKNMLVGVNTQCVRKVAVNLQKRCDIQERLYRPETV
jgi:hypothetical protein